MRSGVQAFPVAGLCHPGFSFNFFCICRKTQTSVHTNPNSFPFKHCSEDNIRELVANIDVTSFGGVLYGVKEVSSCLWSFPSQSPLKWLLPWSVREVGGSPRDGQGGGRLNRERSRGREARNTAKEAQILMLLLRPCVAVTFHRLRTRPWR